MKNIKKTSLTVFIVLMSLQMTILPANNKTFNPDAFTEDLIQRYVSKKNNTRFKKTLMSNLVYGRGQGQEKNIIIESNGSSILTNEELQVWKKNLNKTNFTKYEKRKSCLDNNTHKINFYHKTVIPYEKYNEYLWKYNKRLWAKECITRFKSTAIDYSIDIPLKFFSGVFGIFGRIGNSLEK